MSHKFAGTPFCPEDKSYLNLLVKENYAKSHLFELRKPVLADKWWRSEICLNSCGVTKTALLASFVTTK